VAALKTNIRNIIIIHCYAPKMAAEDESQEFYLQVSEVFRKEKRDILGGDLNAKVSQENVGLEHMGTYGLGERNENGQLLEDFCAKLDLVIGGTMLPHKECHK
jgi:hypothetical protein